MYLNTWFANGASNFPIFRTITYTANETSAWHCKQLYVWIFRLFFSICRRKRVLWWWWWKYYSVTTLRVNVKCVYKREKWRCNNKTRCDQNDAHETTGCVGKVEIWMCFCEYVTRARAHKSGDCCAFGGGGSYVCKCMWWWWRRRGLVSASLFWKWLCVYRVCLRNKHLYV